MYGCVKFHSYVCGLPLQLRLITNIRKTTSPTCSVIWFELIYTPGRYIVLADTLSRAPASRWSKGSCCLSTLSMANVLGQDRTVMRQDMLRCIHEGHLGIENGRREPEKHFIGQALTCILRKWSGNVTRLRHHYKQAREQMLIADIPTEPWQKVAIDLFHLKGKAKTIFW